MPAGSELFIDYGKLSWKPVSTYIPLPRTRSCDHKELQMRLGKQKTQYILGTRAPAATNKRKSEGDRYYMPPTLPSMLHNFSFFHFTFNLEWADF